MRMVGRRKCRHVLFKHVVLTCLFGVTSNFITDFWEIVWGDVMKLSQQFPFFKVLQVAMQSSLELEFPASL